MNRDEIVTTSSAYRGSGRQSIGEAARTIQTAILAGAYVAGS